MNAALAHQQRGEFADADRLYTEALALDPDNFDALHMLGVVAYQRREFRRAETLIRRAIEINPQADTAQYNLQLVLNAHSLDNELCTAVLRTLAPYCKEQAPAPGDPLHLVAFPDAESEPARLYRIALEENLAGAAGVTLWRQQQDGALHVASGAASAAPPRGGGFLFADTRVAPGAWYRDATPSRAVIVCHDAAACDVYDQMRAVTHELAHPVRLWYANGAAARELGLPGGCGDPAALAAWLRAAGGPGRRDA